MKITAIICIHNELTWLPEALSSIAAQTIQVDEILVVKSAETPPQADAIAAQFGAKTTLQPSPGLAAARNAGIEWAQGDALAFLDSDDLWLPEKTALQLHFLQTENADAATGNLLRFSAEPLNGQYSGAHFTQPVPALTPGGLLVKKAALETVGLFNEKYRIACDHEWFMRLMGSPVRWHKHPETVLRKRIHAANLSLQTELYRREIMQMLKNRNV